MSSNIEKELRSLEVLFLESQKLAEYRQQLFSDCLTGITLSLSALVNTIDSEDKFDAKKFAKSLNKIANHILESSPDNIEKTLAAPNVMVQVASAIEKTHQAHEEGRKNQAYKDFLIKLDIPQNQNQKPN